MRLIWAAAALALLARPAASAGEHVKFFGYWTAGAPNDHPEIEELRGTANLVSVNPTKVPKAVWERARRAGMKVMPWVDSDPEDPVAWARFLAAVRPNLDIVAMICVASEPEVVDEHPWEGPWPKTRAMVERWKAVLRRDLPGVPLFINYTSDRVHDGWDLPDADVLAFDQYGCWENCFTDASLPQLIQRFEAKHPRARIILLPHGYADANYGEDLALSLADKYAAYAASDPRVIGLMPFNYFSAGAMTGTRDLPRLRARFAAIGREVVAGGGAAPPGGETGTICVEADSAAPYYVTGPETFGWNGSHCWSGHSAGVWSVSAPGGTVLPARQELAAGQTIRFSVSFGRGPVPAPAPPAGSRTGTICVEADANEGYSVEGPETFGWNGSHCWEGHTPGVWSVSAAGASVSPPRQELQAGGTIRFTVSFAREGAE